MSLTATDRVRHLRRYLKPKLDDYLASDYVGVAVHTNSIIIDVNDAVADMFGYEKDEYIGMNAWILFTPDSADTIMRHLVAKSEEPYRVTGIKKDKTRFEVEVKGKDFEVSGEPVRMAMLKSV